MNIGLLIIATGKYRAFVEGFLASAQAYFFPGKQVHVFLFTDVDERHAGVSTYAIAHQPWPLVTLKRYHIFCQFAGVLREMDYLFYSDIDMRFVAPCGEAILPPGGHDLVGVRHPGYYRRNDDWRSRLSLKLCSMGLRGGLGWHVDLPFERDPRSRACVADSRGRPYFAGGFNGGRTGAFLAMAEAIKAAVDDDLSRDIIAVWHDESHLNRYFVDHPPHGLDPAYCFPETGYPHLRGLIPVLVALDKDHAAVRGELPV